MANAKTFFDRELTQLQQEISRLERALNGYAPDDRRSQGTRAELRLEKRCAQIAEGLTNRAVDPVDVLLWCHMLHHKAERAHARSRNGSARATLCSDAWWDTLGEEQYLADLSRRYESWLRDKRHNGG